MTPGIRPLVAGNWKMNGTAASLNELRAIGHGFMTGLDAETDALICPLRSSKSSSVHSPSCRTTVTHRRPK